MIEREIFPILNAKILAKKMNLEYTANKESKRQEQYDRLKVFIVNPGRFSLLVLGSRGAGKKHAIHSAFNEAKGRFPVTDNLHFINPSQFPIVRTEIDDFLKDFNEGILVIQDVEKLSEIQQDLIFETLSTTDGRFGIKSKFDIRFVFTSSVSPDVLRDEDIGRLSGNFWDRISQLVVKFPSFEEENINITQDFNAVWEKMKFDNTEYNFLSKRPKDYIVDAFLEKNAIRMEGGFRDLDKIAAMYFNYRILFYGSDKKIDDGLEKKIVNEIEKDFFGISQHKSSKEESLSTFIIEDNVKYSDMMIKFRKQLKQLIKSRYGSYEKGRKVLGLNVSTIRKW